ncbi:ABC transporter ATP-binding protein [Lapillicoccus jejuensis]|uniref:Putative ABC transport system ATP-binding protein n=1 Tax=Lapillicoccus jejuensis TaxID=402171 RepID=A0A542E209_9MICO|nr:ABC transporter ATP-binding protein [Lapillicoccus jejuensis]TQJ09368.1 putative ABC transport system ATP-binding protein [Lapillicoccus jejuensis]
MTTTTLSRDTTPAAQPPAARTLDLVKVYGRGEAAVRALDGVGVDLPAGRFTAVMGPSGSGKSTLLHCVAGLDSPTSGEVWLGGTELTRLSDKALTLARRRRVGFVFQSYNLLPMLTAEQNILLPLRLADRRPDAETREWVTGVVDALALGDRLAHRPGELSGGQQQRVAAARALVTRPDLLVADEPTGALDRHSSAELLGFLARSVRELGQTVVMVTHDPSAASYADEVLLMADGRLVGRVAEPTAESVLEAMGRLAEAGR